MDLTRGFSRRIIILSVCVAAVMMVSGAALGAAQPATVKPVSPPQVSDEQTISLELKGADVRDALDALARLSGTNIIADQSVQGTVTVTLNGVPFQQALDLIIKANGFNYRWVGNIVVVAKNERLGEALETAAVQTFPLKNAAPQSMAKALTLILPAENIVVDERSKSLTVKGSPTALSSVKQLLAMLDVEERQVRRVFPLKGALTEGLKQAVEAAVSGLVTAGPGGRSLVVEAAPTELAEVEKILANLDKEEIFSQVFPLRYASPDDLRVSVEKVVPGGEVSVGPGGKSLIVKGTRNQLAQVEKMVPAFDEAAAPVATAAAGTGEAAPAKPEPEATDVRTYDLKYASTEDVKAPLALLAGDKFVVVGKKDRTIAVRGTAAVLAQADQLVQQLDAPIRQVVIEARVEEITATGSRKLGLDWTFPISFVKDPTNLMNVTQIVSDFSATLQALEENGDATVLANPRIAALDGKEASIHIGDRIPVMVEKTRTENNITTTEKVVEYIQVGVILKFTPRFNDDGSVTLNVNPDVSTITGQTPQGYPSIRTRSAQTTMRVKLGETVAMGGLISSNEVDGVRKTPVLGDIPLLGRVFQTQTKEKKQTEVVIFLTPRVVEAGSAAPAGK